MDEPGQTLANVNENTMAFAIDLPNINPENDLVRDANGNLIRPTDWTDYIISVRELETRLQLDQEVSGLHYDFLSNVAPSIQDVIENRSQEEILTWIDANNPTASLLADTTEGSGLKTIGTNTTIGRNSFIKDTVYTITQTEFPSPCKIGIGKVASIEEGFTKSSVSEDGRSQIDFTKASLSERSISKISPWHIAIFKSTFIHTGANEFSTAQVTSAKPTGIEVGVGEVGLMVNNSYIDSIDPVSTSTIPASLISFSSSVLSNQFFSIHDSTPQIINDLNTIATNIWSDLLNPETPLNITFQITNLPNGQLAEAQITSFDASGMPNAGTISIDDDANGKGWFIDSTPLDNSEFVSSNAANYFQADVNSAAYGKYDLLTTLLHEFAHLYGLVDGFWGFDDRISTKNGIHYFTGDNFTATLDGEHLDKQAHPYDLFNTNLAPGMRKLPSELDVQILSAIFATNNENQKQENAALKAPLTSTPLSALILNGTFDSTNPANPNYGWSTRGDSAIINGQAILGESDRNQRHRSD